MTPLFSAAGAARMDAVVRPGLLCVFDFDGTLAPIVAQPDQARLPAPVRQRLLILQRHVPIAILTGRSLSDMAGRLDFAPDFLVGNHGLEGLPASQDRRAEFENLCAVWRGALAAAFADRAAFDPGIVIEDKQISLSVHYRHAGDAERAERGLRALFETLAPRPRIIAGKFVFNLLPHGAGDKGSAFEELMHLSGAAHAIYVGDDVTDEHVFALRRADTLSVRIGAVPESAAAFVLADHDDIVALLDDLIQRAAITSLVRRALPRDGGSVAPNPRSHAAASCPDTSTRPGRQTRLEDS